MKKYSDKQIKKLWKEFNDIPICPTCETIEEDFHIWETGTGKMKIWHWFDDNYSKGLAEGLMKLRR